MDTQGGAGAANSSSDFVRKLYKYIFRAHFDSQTTRLTSLLQNVGRSLIFVSRALG